MTKLYIKSLILSVLEKELIPMTELNIEFAIIELWDESIKPKELKNALSELLESQKIKLIGKNKYYYLQS